ncbi:ribosomal protein L7/L12 [Sphingomonas sp.]|uniref:ribosomal protein L7/L12 n=1 Tax=Sphingomonas sp. TaxID=28214 RepID=UPI003B3BAF8B
MFVPVPILVLVGLAFVVLILLLARASRRPDPLMGAPRVGSRSDPPTTRRQMPVMPQAATAPPVTLPPEIELKVRALAASGRKIEAIKLARDTLHLGLREAKDLVESFE